MKPFRTPVFTSPGAFGAPQEDVSIRTEDGYDLSAWWVEAADSEVVAVLAHGYYLNRSELAPVAFWLWQRGISSVLFDFRAHGRTRGGTCSFGVRERADVAAAVRYVRERKPGVKVVAIGSSMGSVASAFAWAEDAALLDALVLDSAYGKLSRAILGWWRFVGGNALAVVLSPTVLLGGFFARLNPFTTDLSGPLAKLRGKKVLVLHGTRDQVATKSEAERNLQALGSAEVVWFEGCNHSEGRWLQPVKYQDAIEGFLTELKTPLPVPGEGQVEKDAS